MDINNAKKNPPSIDDWLAEAKTDPVASGIGMFLVHNGVVRETPKAKVRQGVSDGSVVKSLDFSYEKEKVEQAVAEAKKMDGIFYIKAWLNEGKLNVGDDIMRILIGGDIRPHVINALQFLVEKIKSECVTEIEHRE
jgi:molybdopterin synthase catalytic subunit